MRASFVESRDTTAFEHSRGAERDAEYGEEVSMLEQKAKRAYLEWERRKEEERRAYERRKYEKGLASLAEAFGFPPETLEDELNRIFTPNGWKIKWLYVGGRRCSDYFLSVKGKCPYCGQEVWSKPIGDLAELGKLFQKGFEVDFERHRCPEFFDLQERR